MSIDTVTATPQHALVNPGKILQTALAFWQSKTLLTAAELDLFTILAKEPMLPASSTNDLD